MKPLILTRDKHIINIFNQELNKTLRYNLKIKSMQKQDKEGKWICIKQQYPFFQNYSINNIECKEKKFKGMIEKTKTLNPRCSSVSSFISRMNDALVYENYEAEGIETECYISSGYGYFRKDILSKPLEFYSKNVIKFIKENNIKVTCEFEECFIQNKKLMEKIIDTIQYCDITNEQKLEFIEKLSDRSYTYNNFIILINEYNYDIKSLIHYLYNYLLPFENIDPTNGLSNLSDYYRMASTIGRNVKKYPKYLRSMHDIITANYNAHKRKYDEKLFKQLSKPELEFEGKEFCVVIPIDSKDIIREGTDLNHCVSSYVDRILKKELYIFFLRMTKHKNNSLVTLQLNNGVITQAKGSYNRKPSEDEMKFLKSYSKKLNISIKI